MRRMIRLLDWLNTGIDECTIPGYGKDIGSATQNQLWYKLRIRKQAFQQFDDINFVLRKLLK